MCGSTTLKATQTPLTLDSNGNVLLGTSSIGTLDPFSLDYAIFLSATGISTLTSMKIDVSKMQFSKIVHVTFSSGFSSNTDISGTISPSP